MTFPINFNWFKTYVLDQIKQMDLLEFMTELDI